MVAAEKSIGWMIISECGQQVEFQNRVVSSDSQETYDLMTLFRDPSSLWLLPDERPIGWVGFALTCTGMTRCSCCTIPKEESEAAGTVRTAGF